MANSYLDQNSSLGFGTLVNAGAIISHDVVLSDFSSVGPGAKIAGNVSIGRNTHIGIGATIIEERKIEKNVIIGAGATVVKDVERNSLVYGTPAKFIRSVSPLDKLI
jgi:acetyltransferase EpsM|tara:strand:+ start:120 stop:440 length:321 start_codon:yes stop_codon:yes gene_type:complete